MEIFFFWVALSIVAAWIASKKGRSGVNAFLLSMVLSPVIGLIVAIFLDRRERPGTVAYEEATAERVRCPDCRELVLAEARKCKHCGCGLVPQSEVAARQAAGSSTTGGFDEWRGPKRKT